MKPSEEAYIDEQNAKAVERARKLKLARDYVGPDVYLNDRTLLGIAERLEARNERP